MTAPDAVRHLRVPGPVDVALTLRPLQRGSADPTVRAVPQGVWLTRREPEDPSDPSSPALPASLLVSPAVRGGRTPAAEPGTPASGTRAGTAAAPPSGAWTVTVRAWGPGAQAAVARAETLLGGGDADWPAFDALADPRADPPGVRPPLPAHVWRVRHDRPGLRLPAAGALATQLMTVALEQKVTHDQARHGWRTLVRLAAAHDGEPAPGPVPTGMLPPPTPRAVLRIPSWDWHARAWVQPSQARAVLEVAARAATIDRLGHAVRPGDTAGIAALAERLHAIPGIGPWSTAEALQRSHGAADLVSVGDFHLAHHVGQVLTGRRTDDDGMMRLLAPWAGHRHRVVRLIGLSGERRQAFGPRLTPADHRRH